MSDLVVIDEILDGGYDAYLDVFIQAISKRKESLSERKLLFLNPGDTVRFNRNTRPKYLQGILAEVIKVNQKRVVVKVKEGQYGARKYGHGEFATPVNLVDKVEA